MNEAKAAGRHLAAQYHEVCSMILNITDRMAMEWEELYEMAYKARGTDMPDKNKPPTSPVENVVVLIEKMRNEMDARYVEEIAELERKRMDMEGIISSANLTADEDRVFYLRYGLGRKRINIASIADTIYYSERHVKRLLDKGYEKMGMVL